MHRWAAAALTLAAQVACAASPFAVTARLDRVADAGVTGITVSAQIPDGHYLYADQWQVTSSSGRLAPRGSLPSERAIDRFSGEDRDLLKRSFEVSYGIGGWDGRQPLTITIGFQGCTPTLCLLPETVRIPLAGGTTAAAPPGAAPSAGDRSWLDGRRVTASAAGYLDASAFLAFLDRSEQRDGAEGTPSAGFSTDPAGFLQRHGLWLTLLLVLLGGLMLNLTPCVLPMIPVNLAIIGASTAGQPRRRGLALGAAYGSGIALVYGCLGLLAVLTGAAFGAVQSSTWFNLAVALIFLALMLAMFDVIPIDLTRFQPQGVQRRGYGTVMLLGGISALLAGACVAPVVMGVLLLSINLHASGEPMALLLPFLLGVGMGLPWPLAAAGLARLPRPGRWMHAVKIGFGLVMLGFAIHYGRLAWTSLRGTVGTQAGDRSAWERELAEAGDKPVLVDFWANWCKSCHTMERTTFRDPAVVKRLEDFHVVRVQAEQPSLEPAAGMLRAFGVLGLPAYAVIEKE